MSNVMRKWGWKRQRPDFRDLQYRNFGESVEVKKSVDLRPNCPIIYDQGALGSCTANAVGSAFQFSEMKQGVSHAEKIPSRLFIYYNERLMEGSVNEDSGATLRDGIKSLVRWGVCHESTWPYVIEKFAITPPPGCYSEASKNQVLRYYAVEQTELEFEKCLSAGYPFVFGFSVYESFDKGDWHKIHGVMPFPKADESCLGGHAVTAVGYDHDKRIFIIRNSWGTNWGQKGYFYMPYDVILNPGLACDFWTIRLVEDGK